MYYVNIISGIFESEIIKNNSDSIRPNQSIDKEDAKIFRAVKGPIVLKNEQTNISSNTNLKHQNMVNITKAPNEMTKLNDSNASFNVFNFNNTKIRSTDDHKFHFLNSN